MLGCSILFFIFDSEEFSSSSSSLLPILLLSHYDCYDVCDFFFLFLQAVTYESIGLFNHYPFLWLDKLETVFDSCLSSVQLSDIVSDFTVLIIGCLVLQLYRILVEEDSLDVTLIQIYYILFKYTIFWSNTPYLVQIYYILVKYQPQLPLNLGRDDGMIRFQSCFVWNTEQPLHATIVKSVRSRRQWNNVNDNLYTWNTEKSMIEKIYYTLTDDCICGMSRKYRTSFVFLCRFCLWILFTINCRYLSLFSSLSQHYRILFCIFPQMPRPCCW